MEICQATPAHHAELLSILDAAAIRTDGDATRSAIERGDVLIALPDYGIEAQRDHSVPVVGTLAVDDAEIVAIAVRPGRRGQGIGRALVTRAKQDRQRLVAEFDPGVRPFWAAVGFEIQKGESNRLTGVWRE